MNYKLDKGAHSIYTLQYHFIQVVNHRKKIFANERLIDFLRQKANEISESFGVEIINFECDKDYIYMIFKSKPTLNIPKYINTLKTISSRELQRKFPEIKKQLWKGVLWSPSYFLATTGQITLDMLKKYVENQRRI
ncbi:MAG: IS200/IS605 family transposase [Candidatus Micrarchaeia archaeon]